jgi:hypothetical protein
MSIKFPNCCLALQTANDVDMVVCEQGEISWYTGGRDDEDQPLVKTVTECPFCGQREDDKITL